MIWQIKGYGRYKLSGADVFAFLNVCKNSSVEVRNIYTANGTTVFEIKNSDFEKCDALAKQLGAVLVSCGNFGLASKIKAYRKRKIFVLSFITVFIIFALNLCFISRITVTGNKSLTNAQILETLAESGVKHGTFAFFVDQHEIQRKMMQKCDALSWVWIEIKGTHAIVEVRERIRIPEIYDRNFACNVIAGNDGVVKRAIASSGILYAKEGAYVRKGELLIGGVYDSNEYAPVRFVHADGEILAQTFYTAEADFEKSYIKYSKSEKTKTAYGVTLGNFVIEKKINEKNVFLINDVKKNMKIFGNFYLPLGFTKREYCEIIENKYELSASALEKEAVNELTLRLKQTIPDGAVVENSEKSISCNPDGTIHVRLTFECTENIGVESPIEFTQE